MGPDPLLLDDLRGLNESEVVSPSKRLQPTAHQGQNMIFTFNKIVYSIWGIFFSYWFFSDLGHKSKMERRESLFSRWLDLSLFGLAISLIVFDPPIYGPLLWPILPEGRVLDFIGVAILILGLGLAVWARLHWGRYWSARIVLEEGHRLIQTGPYHFVRNPIYFGGLVAVFGTAIVVGEVRGVLAFVLVLIALGRKIRLEERWLGERFGPAYAEYRKKVKIFIPFIY
jgi:protein-S-isoprenylcysteine O-methyltransferase Ste14